MKANKKHLLILFVCALILFIVPSCDNSLDPEVPSWQLVWQDEFEGPDGQSPDSTKWTYDIGTDWGNAQLEYDTDD